MMIQVMGAFIAVISIAVTFGVPKKFLIHAGTVGAVGWLVHLILSSMGLPIVTSMFFAALTIALLSHSYARILKTPVTLFLITGILPLVPGVGMYQIVYYLITDDQKLSGYYFNQTMQIAGMIALAIFIIDTVFRFFQKK
ncbi:threonine/serine exporter family protein [Anaerocolumna aminovalerica]|jgi:uncharacterized membrane protein YjjB (DUF3815 family)|uniref:Uncharacterized membrane protein YjjB, DUF3815 family n=1 Tax=Anaerocolumna aminovalerica TaxID=1527 RepID=A0A1I5EXK7_9FIRM|nr:threonine/serine exporter family protein [Anaerocolumna aminovalerica]MDU6266216.1 threonine/serine exporter family protein [Anaerocolumna aminovalerica]SFO15781.1 Uncharacterized membrane protein YjjB, DUF3815 family [Anaerocolumna aminovalerica]